MREPQPFRTRVRGGFWGTRLRTNETEALPHQWEQLESTGCLANFRIAAGRCEGIRAGLFFSDSDAYKWLEAAALVLPEADDPVLAARVDELVSLLAEAQEADGYLYTYNQILFPGQRWGNLQLEHEMYCLGHLIEAGVSHHLATGDRRLLEVARRSADLLVREFREAGPEGTDGHEEIELALLRLYRATEEPAYRDLAARLLERRGRARWYPGILLPQVLRTARRLHHARRQRAAWLERHAGVAEATLPPPNKTRTPPLTWLRLAREMWSGRYFQQHAPLREQAVPVGHAVRFTYLAAAGAMLARDTGDRELGAVLGPAWEHMVTRRMYVTGGLGSLPLVEGFGEDLELDPEVAYAETCAAIGSMRWSSEMGGLSGDARYDDLFEWQLYNAAAVGMGLSGRSYLYNNPLTCRGGIGRVAWYLVPCCPSNLSRTWASLAGHVCRGGQERLQVAQYLSSEVETEWGRMTVESDLPWEGTVRITLQPRRPGESMLAVRLPSWTDGIAVSVNGEGIREERTAPPSPSACGYSPCAARWVELRRAWETGDVVQVAVGMPLRMWRQNEQVPGCGGMYALSRGPLVYCLESIDNPQGVFGIEPDRSSLQVVEEPDLLGGIRTIRGRSTDGRPLCFIPYMLWGNRGPSQMTVFFR